MHRSSACVDKLLIPTFVNVSRMLTQSVSCSSVKPLQIPNYLELLLHNRSLRWRYERFSLALLPVKDPLIVVTSELTWCLLSWNPSIFYVHFCTRYTKCFLHPFVVISFYKNSDSALKIQERITSLLFLVRYLVTRY